MLYHNHSNNWVKPRPLLLRTGLIKDVTFHPIVQNIVATLDLGSRLDFSMVLQNILNYTYEPETFPAIIYRTANGPTALIFGSGKLVITGSKTERELQGTARNLMIKLINFNWIRSTVYSLLPFLPNYERWRMAIKCFKSDLDSTQTMQIWTQFRF